MIFQQFIMVTLHSDCNMTEDKTLTPKCCGLNFNSLEGVLFDIDGTLTNSDPLHFKA
jgi:hypothetical protein